jgi:hypothetical protein
MLLLPNAICVAEDLEIHYVSFVKVARDLLIVYSSNEVSVEGFGVI